MSSRNPSQPFDEVAHLGGTGARMVEDPSAMVTEPVAAGETAAERILQHTHAADRLPSAPVVPVQTRPRTETVAQQIGYWIGTATRRFEQIRQSAQRTDATGKKANAMDMARRYPVQALAGALVAGLLAGRLLRRR